MIILIDIHCHIIPGVDDGAQTVAESVALAEAAVRDGIHTIVATPHHHDGHYLNEGSSVRVHVEQLNLVLRERQIPLTVLPGQEIRYYDGLVDDLEQERDVLTLHDSRYLLLEFPSYEVPKGVKDAIHEFQLMGLVPIIAHPERNKELARHPERLAELIELGALAQVTSLSLTGGFGKTIQSASLDLCRRNLIHLVGSDAHHIKKRPFVLSEAYEVIRSRIGADAEEYYKENAANVIENREIEVAVPVKKKRNLFFLWKK